MEYTSGIPTRCRQKIRYDLFKKDHLIKLINDKMEGDKDWQEMIRSEVTKLQSTVFTETQGAARRMGRKLQYETKFNLEKQCQLQPLPLQDQHKHAFQYPWQSWSHMQQTNLISETQSTFVSSRTFNSQVGSTPQGQAEPVLKLSKSATSVEWDEVGYVTEDSAVCYQCLPFGNKHNPQYRLTSQANIHNTKLNWSYQSAINQSSHFGSYGSRSLANRLAGKFPDSLTSINEETFQNLDVGDASKESTSINDERNTINVVGTDEESSWEWRYLPDNPHRPPNNQQLKIDVSESLFNGEGEFLPKYPAIGKTNRQEPTENIHWEINNASRICDPLLGGFETTDILMQPNVEFTSPAQNFDEAELKNILASLLNETPNQPNSYQTSLQDLIDLEEILKQVIG